MTNDLTIADHHEVDFSGFTNEQLRQDLAEQLSLTATALSRAASIWTELQRRGVDLTALRSGLAFYLPRIARGDLAAEAVVAFAGQRVLLQNLAGMPLDDQRRYAAGAPVDVAERREDGQIVAIPKALVDLSAREVMLSISAGQIRPVRAQTESLVRTAKKPSARRKSTGSTVTIKASASEGLLHIGRSRLEPLDLARALRDLGFELRRIDA